MMQLYIANKNYSSWSMRPWLVLKAFDLAFEEIQLNFPCERGEGDFKQRVLEINPNGKVPALLDQGMLIWDSLAICEYLAEQYPEQALWPRSADPYPASRFRQGSSSPPCPVPRELSG